MIPLAQIDEIAQLQQEWTMFCQAAQMWMQRRGTPNPAAANMAREYAMAAKRTYDALQRAIREARDE